MDVERIKMEVEEAEGRLLGLLREGQLIEGVAIHLDDPSYHNIWDGEDKTHDMLEQLIRQGMEKGMTRIDYQVSRREYLFINKEHVLQTLYSRDKTFMKSGEIIVSRPTVISILWKKLQGEWRLAYLHASEKPKSQQ